MKRFILIVTALFLLAVFVSHYIPRCSPTPAVSTKVLRDSIEAKRDTVGKLTTIYITKIKRIPQDTLGPILRALAARQVIRGTDTIRPEPVDTTCRVLLTCSEARQLAIRDTVKEERQDSTNGDVKIQTARADSIAARLETCLNKKPFIGYITAFEAGYVAGTVVTAGVCLITR